MRHLRIAWTSPWLVRGSAVLLLWLSSTLWSGAGFAQQAQPPQKPPGEIADTPSKPDQTTTGDVNPDAGTSEDAAAASDDEEQPPPKVVKKKPPDGLLPVAELTRLGYTPRDAPKPLLYGNHLLVVGSSGFVEGHDAETGTFAWKLGLPGEELFEPVMFEAGKLVRGATDAFTVVLSEPTGHVLLVNGLTGEIVNETRLPFELALPPIRGPGDLVFLATPSGDILGYDVLKTEVTFQTATGERPLAIASTESVVMVSGASQNLTALKLPDGGVLWSFRGRAGFHAPAVFSNDATRVYIGDDTGEFYCLDASLGTVKFRWSTGAAIRNPPLIEGRRIYLATYANTLFAFNAQSGDEHWRTNLPGRPSTPPMRVRTRLMVATFDGVLLEINPQRGQSAKRYAAPGEIIGAPSFFLAEPSPEELAQLDAEAEANPPPEDDEDGRNVLDPEIFGPEELDTSEPVPEDDPAGDDAPLNEAQAEQDAELSAEGNGTDSVDPMVVSEPEWFERSRIAIALRSGEVLLLGPASAQASPSADDDDSETDDEEGGRGRGGGRGRRRPPSSARTR